MTHHEPAAKNAQEFPIADQKVRHPARRWLIGAVGVALLAGVVAHVVTGDDLSSLRRLSIPVLLTTLFLQVAAQMLFNSVIFVPLRTHLPQLNYWELFLVRTGGFFAGYVLPVAGGLAVRMAYLKRQGLTYQDFASATVLSNVTALVTIGMLTTTAVALLWILAGPPPAAVLGLTVAVLALAAASVFVFRWLPRVASHEWFDRWPWLASYTRYDADMGSWPRLLALSLARHTLNFITFGLLYFSLSGAPRGFLAGGLVYAITSPVRMIQITPGNLGVNEWIVGLVGRMVAFDVAVGLLVALVFRALGAAAQGVGVLIATTRISLGKRA